MPPRDKMRAFDADGSAFGQMAQLVDFRRAGDFDGRRRDGFCW